ncbi:hypothetical protein [Solibacillus sp. FSL K6-1523]|uniref:hypothetical protein n=1 Tax=Solibacillus sp. FSL K6-1523 TaxID=2921471 RepID=UPI0030F7CD03
MNKKFNLLKKTFGNLLMFISYSLLFFLVVEPKVRATLYGEFGEFAVIVTTVIFIFGLVCIYIVPMLFVNKEK